MSAPDGTPPCFGWALVGPGQIARRFAAALQGVEGAYLAAVVGRDTARAQAFAAQYNPSAWAGTELQAALARPDVQALYIATPHPQHANAAVAALHAGKPVLCEKPLTPCAASSRALIALSRERKVFLMEAVWMRFLPVYQQVRAWLDAREIGAVHTTQSSFCIHRPIQAGHRRYSPAQGGGSLLEIGLYNLTAASIVWPDAPAERFMADAHLSDDGIDMQVAAMVDHGPGRRNQFVCGFMGTSDNRLEILGEHGHIVVHDGFWHSNRATLHRHGHEPLEVQAPFRVNGLEYEIEESMRCIRAGAIESPLMPHRQSLALVELMDAIRARVGVRYPFEQETA